MATDTTVQPTLDSAYIAELHAQLRRERPLVHNITNYVVMSLSANVLLALGASPAMVHAVEEVEDFVSISSALVVNIGTLSPSWVEGMQRAAARAVASGKPWVLDPVGCGATPYRTRVAAELAQQKPTIIRGNASEILSLAGTAAAGGKGVDSTADSDAAVSAAVALAQRTGAVVAVTGAVDYVSDGKQLVCIEGGAELMTLSTGLGCALSATTAAFAAITSPLHAASAALTIYGAAGRHAARSCKGPGHLPGELCDALYSMDRDRLENNTAITTRTLA